VVIPQDVRAQLVAHAQEEVPNEACGLVLLRDGRADRYERGRNAASSPYRFELEFDDPEIWFAEDDGYELAVFHSHISAPALPSRTDVENIGLWAGKSYLVYSLKDDDLAAFVIEDGQIEDLPLT
jgi:proteasome lid subunit RPN8/RPN11